MVSPVTSGGHSTKGSLQDYSFATGTHARSVSGGGRDDRTVLSVSVAGDINASRDDAHSIVISPRGAGGELGIRRYVSLEGTGGPDDGSDGQSIGSLQPSVASSSAGTALQKGSPRQPHGGGQKEAPRGSQLRGADAGRVQTLRRTHSAQPMQML